MRKKKPMQFSLNQQLCSLYESQVQDMVLRRTWGMIGKDNQIT